MSCYRIGCGNIMCDTYIPEIGYVCYECQKEFKKYLGTNTEIKLKASLSSFMETRKGFYDEQKEITVDEFFNKFS